MTSRVKGLTPESFETLRREIGALKRQLANQERRLATVSTRRHEAVWAGEYGVYGTAYATGGTVTTDAVTQVNMSSVAMTNMQGYATEDVFEVTSGYLTALRSGIYFFSLLTGFQILRVRSQNTQLGVYVQVQAKDSASWGGTGIGVYMKADYVDAPVGSQVTGSQCFTQLGFPLMEGDKLRLITEGVVSGGPWPGSTAIGSVYLQFARTWRIQPAPGTTFH